MIEDKKMPQDCILIWKIPRDKPDRDTVITTALSPAIMETKDPHLPWM